MKTSLFTRVVLVLVVLVTLGGGPGAAVAQSDQPTDDALPPGVEAPTSLPEPTDKHPKLDSQLIALARRQSELGLQSALAEAQARSVPIVNGLVRVEIETSQGVSTGVVAAIVSARGQVEVDYPELVQALLPMSALEALAARDDVHFIRPPLRKETDAVAGEGVNATGAKAWHTGGVNGAGVKVGIIDTGFRGYAARQASGDLPASLTTKDFCNGNLATGSDHGTGVAEIVYEMAPGAQLFLICAQTASNDRQAKDYAISQGIQIINYSASVFNTGRGDGSGGPSTPDGIVADARANGILWVNSAGNYAELHWSGTYTDTNANNRHNFTPTDEGNTFTLSAGKQTCVYLKWDDWPASAQDYDLYLIRSSDLATVASSVNSQTGTQQPTERLCYTNSTAAPLQLAVAIDRASATTTPRFDLYITGSVSRPQYVTSEGSIPEPGSSPNAFTAGAICWKTNALEPYSSRGPTIDNRIKPDIAGQDSVSSVTYGAFSTCGDSGFTGTSAAAPHVTGAAALVKQAYSSADPAQLETYLTNRAIDLDVAGKDNWHGWGKLWLNDTQPDLEPGDLFVGAGVDLGYQETSGVILRVRGGSTLPFCQSPTNGNDPNFWNIPRDVMVDSQGRVVFLAYLGSAFFEYGDYGLFRCSTPGAPPEKLGIFPSDSDFDPGYPIPFPGDYFQDVRGLHLARVMSIVIDDETNGGAPRAVIEDAYVFVAARWDPTYPPRRLSLKTVRYHVTTGIWDEGPEPPQKYVTQNTTVGTPDAVNHAGSTYFAQEEILRRYRDPVRLDVSGKTGGNDFDLHLPLFSSVKEIGGLLVDDVGIPNVPSGCPPPPQPPVSDDMPEQRVGLNSVYNIVFDEHGDHGMILTQQSIFLPPYLTNGSEVLLNDDPNDDRTQYFRDANALPIGCVPTPSLKYASIVPWWNPDTGDPNGASDLATAPGGLVATQHHEGKVVRVTPGKGVVPLVTGLIRPYGIASYPAVVPPLSGSVFVIRVDSPVDVLVTDANGRRIGVDPATGQPVNDFGDDAFDSGPGEPRVYAILNPAPGDFSIQGMGTGEGAFTLHAYSSDLSQPDGQHISTSGTAFPGSVFNHTLTLNADATIAFSTHKVYLPVVVR